MRKRFRRQTRWQAAWSLVMAVVFSLLITGPAPVFAASGKDVLSRQMVTIPQGEVAEDVLVIGNDATVSGVVYDNLVVVGGDIHLTGTARAGVVIDLGGHLTEDPGAHANAVFTLSFRQPFLNSLAIGSALVVAVWSLRLALSAALVALPVLVSVLLRSYLDRPVSFVSQSVRRTGLMGLLVSVVFGALGTVAAITVVGLPITAILLCVYAGIGVVGLGGVSAWIGRMTVFGAPERPLWLRTLLGATFLMAFGNIPMVGPILLTIAWWVGVGAVTMWAWRGWRFRKAKGWVQ
ncbi:hypothetical protein [Alicyclobacillus sp.]|uniref:hypothetical protein n=1 Tax=Alicyclobacillus sp. TaxID=61169 RepID=UPI0025C25CD3|nr:hypothetical protein [Alicyclobacillus sp.]MCL6517084.1 hypothetical protein [Alicyclobacillus sp.]